ncbi:hypothetical protein F4802DRAFT_576752 [Xylaria palmicola]|nr:hypothetical protein F4802DRAFT_576752 [Xylaria palmicola]
MADRVEKLRKRDSQRAVEQGHRKDEGEPKPANQPRPPTLENIVLDFESEAPEVVESIMCQAKDACSSFPFPRPRETIRAYSPEGSAMWQFTTDMQGDERDEKTVSDIDEYLAPLQIIHRLCLARSAIPLSPQDQQTTCEVLKNYPEHCYGITEKISGPLISGAGLIGVQQFYLSLSHSKISNLMTRIFGREITLDDIKGSPKAVFNNLASLALKKSNLQDSAAKVHCSKPSEVATLVAVQALLNAEALEWSQWITAAGQFIDCFGMDETLQPFWEDSTGRKVRASTT